MLLSRRAAVAAPRLLTHRAALTAPWTRLFSSEASAPAPTPESEPTKSEPAKSGATQENKSSSTVASSRSAGAAKSAPTASKWAYKSNSTKPAPTAPMPPPVQYLAQTIAHETQASSADEPAPQALDWTASFHGVSTKPVSEAQYKVLLKPIEESDVEVKPDGVIYLPEIKYRRRLNEAFGPMGWGMIPKGEPVVGDTIVTREYALIADGRFVSQAQGENNFFTQEQLPSAVEGCKSNALMRCCKDLGIGSELWDPHYVRWFKKTHMEEVWVEHVTTKKKRTFWYRKGQAEVAYPYKLSR